MTDGHKATTQPAGVTDGSDVGAALLSAKIDLEPPARRAQHGKESIVVPGNPGTPGQDLPGDSEPPGLEPEVDNDGDAMF